MSKARDFLEDATWHIKEGFLNLSRKKQLIVFSAILLLVLLLIFSLIVKRETADNEKEVRGQLQKVAKSVNENLSEALRTLPTEMVRNLQSIKSAQKDANADSFSGSIAKSTKRGKCLGFEINIKADYILSGNQEAVSVQEVKELARANCMVLPTN